MQTLIRGRAFVLGDNIDTDQIIPAEFLSYDPSDPEERKFFGRYALSGVPKEQSGLPAGNTQFVAPNEFRSPYTVVVAGRNFGCGSSREHAPLALAQAGCRVVVAQSYARIFYRNSINGGYVLPLETVARVSDMVRTGDEVQIDLTAGTLRNLTTGAATPLEPTGGVQDIIDAGGIFAYARQQKLIV